MPSHPPHPAYTTVTVKLNSTVRPLLLDTLCLTNGILTANVLFASTVYITVTLLCFNGEIFNHIMFVEVLA